MNSFRTLKVGMTSILAICAIAQAQQSDAPGSDVLHLETKVGSFKILGAGNDLPKGHLELNFSGSVLISGLNGTVVPTGKLKKEYDNAKRKRLVYSGTGKLVVDGTFKNVQWFGRDMSATYKGRAVFRLYGEFDKDLNTGNYWYDADPTKNQWMTGGRELLVPMRQMSGSVKPKIRQS